MPGIVEARTRMVLERTGLVGEDPNELLVIGSPYSGGSDGLKPGSEIQYVQQPDGGVGPQIGREKVFGPGYTFDNLGAAALNGFFGRQARTSLQEGSEGLEPGQGVGASEPLSAIDATLRRDEETGVVTANVNERVADLAPDRQVMLSVVSREGFTEGQYGQWWSPADVRGVMGSTVLGLSELSAFGGAVNYMSPEALRVDFPER